MQKLYCKLKFTYNMEISELEKKIYEKEFMVLREDLINYLNPNYEKWNEEYDKLFGKESAKVNEEAYNLFIQKKHRDVIKTFNKTHKSTFIEMDSDEDADIIGIGKVRKGLQMRLSIIPVGDWGDLVKN